MIDHIRFIYVWSYIKMYVRLIIYQDVFMFDHMLKCMYGWSHTKMYYVWTSTKMYMCLIMYQICAWSCTMMYSILCQDVFVFVQVPGSICFFNYNCIPRYLYLIRYQDVLMFDCISRYISARSHTKNLCLIIYHDVFAFDHTPRLICVWSYIKMY